MMFAVLAGNCSFWCVWQAYQLSLVAVPVGLLASVLWDRAWLHGQRSCRHFESIEDDG